MAALLVRVYKHCSLKEYYQSSRINGKPEVLPFYSSEEPLNHLSKIKPTCLVWLGVLVFLVVLGGFVVVFVGGLYLWLGWFFLNKEFFYYYLCST